MINRLLNFYKENLNVNQLVFDGIKKWEGLAVMSPIIWILLILFFSKVVCKSPASSGGIDIIVFYIATVPIVIYCAIDLLNQKAKEKIDNKYDLKEHDYKIKAFHLYWNTDEIYSLVKADAMDQLLKRIKQEHDNVTAKDIRELSKLSEKRAKEIEYDFIPYLTVFATVVIPLWSSFTNWMFRFEMTLGTGIILFITILGSILILYTFLNNSHFF